MNIVVSQFSFSFSRIIIEGLIEKVGPENVYNLSATNGKIEDDFQGSIIHNYNFNDNFYGYYNGVDFNLLTPLDANILAEFHDLESEVMEMMDRDTPSICNGINAVDENYMNSKVVEIDDLSGFKTKKKSFRDRKDIYYRHLRYWFDFFSNNPVDYFISFYVPHTTQAYITWRVAKYFGAKDVIGMKSVIAGNFVFVNDIDNSSKDIYDEFVKIKATAKNENVNFKSTVFNHEIPRIIENLDPWYMDKKAVTNVLSKSKFSQELEENYREGKLSKTQELNFSFSYWAFVLTVFKFFLLPIFRTRFNSKNLFLIDEFKSRLKNKLQLNSASEIDKFLSRVSYDINPDDKFVYFPLHMQPEATTRPLGGKYANQLIAIKMLSSVLPENWKIYVKEHPNQKMIFRGIDFYKKLSEIKHVNILKTNISTFDLINGCEAVSTITGVAGWESVVLGKNCLLFGNTLFDKCPGVLKINTFEDCKKSISIVENGIQRPKLIEVKMYLKALENVSVDAADIPHTFELRKFNVLKHKNRVLKAIMEKI